MRVHHTQHRQSAIDLPHEATRGGLHRTAEPNVRLTGFSTRTRRNRRSDASLAFLSPPE
jgi:hypothetical protein